MKSYGARELIQCLECLGYKAQPQVGSRHLKFRSPNKIEKGKHPFIIVIQNRNTYDPEYQRGYIQEIKRHGFTISQIEKCM